MKSSLAYRYAAAAVLAVVLFLEYFWRFLPYSERYRPKNEPNWWVFLAIMLAAGFLLTVGMERHRFRVCTCLLGTLFAANAVLIVVDCIPDPSNHNLLPFEFAMIAVFTLPAYLGAWIASAAGRLRKPAPEISRTPTQGV